MAESPRPRLGRTGRRARASRACIRRASTVASAVLVLVALAACGRDLPNTTFNPHTEFGREIDALWNLLLNLGTVVFILVEALLVYALIRFRHRPGQEEPAHVHGNTTLEILWTVIPALVLVFIAVPTVRTIFRTQRNAPASGLQVEVYGHQWWWEFHYPQYNVTTANELYLPIGRTANFILRTKDVLHSFWIPQLGGKRDLISNHTNYLWFTPDSTMQASVWNGQCAEYCGASHGDMRMRVYTVPAADFEQWAAHQATPAAFADPPGDTTHRAPPGPAGYAFPKAQMPDYAIPHTPTPEGLTFSAGLTGDPARGEKTYSSQACIGCHTIAGNKMSMGVIGPNLTHVASRNTIAAGLYPNDTDHLRLWIKNAREMKPGVTMPTLGAGQLDPITGSRVPTSGLTDQQIADIVAYLQQLR